MPDWTKSMQQTYEYYTVDPVSLKDKKRLTNIEGCTINRDDSVDTLGSATIDFTETVGEDYVRAYLVTIQNGVTERHPLGTVMVQTPSSDFDGMVRKISADAYTPLIELKEKMPPIGFALFKDDNIMERAYLLTRDNVRVPVIPVTADNTLPSDFVADPSDTWLAYIKALMDDAKYSFALDDLGRILFSPKQDTASLQPVWTYDDGNSSILYSEISIGHDLYDVPNVVEVIYSDETDSFSARVINDDSNSPVSTINRGREVLYRETSPKIDGVPTQAMIEEYAKRLLREKSAVEYTLSYTHAYCGTRVGDCVRLNYNRAGLKDVKAKIISQSIQCKPGCPVSEKAVFTTKLWG